MKSWFGRSWKVYSYASTIEQLEERILLDATLGVLVAAQPQLPDAAQVSSQDMGQDQGQAPPATAPAPADSVALPDSAAIVVCEKPDAGCSVIETATVATSGPSPEPSSAALRLAIEPTTAATPAEGAATAAERLAGTSGAGNTSQVSEPPGSSLAALEPDLKTVSVAQDQAESARGAPSSDATAATVAPENKLSTPSPLDAAHDAWAVADSQPVPASLADTPVRVLVINSNVQDAPELVEAAQDGVVTVVYDGREGTPDQVLAWITDALDGRKADSIAFATHHVGQGAFQLVGGYAVTEAALADNAALQGFWRGLAADLTPNGRVDILACSLAGSAEGSAVLSQLEMLTGHAVAASDDLTGNLASGGDWFLEKGNVDVSATYFVAQSLLDFQGVLVGPTVQAPIPDVVVNEDAVDTVLNLYNYFQDTEDPDNLLTYTVVGNTNPGLFGTVGSPFPVTKWTPASLQAGDRFGGAMDMDGDYAIVGAYYDDDKGSNSGSAYILHWNGTTWEQQAKLTASDGAANRDFGDSVFIRGNYAIVGSACDDTGATDSGSAFIFVRSGTNWSQVAKLWASDRTASDYFGCSVSMDGDYAIVGAYYDDDKGSNSGSAYIFHWNGTAWVQEAKILASDGAANDNFGGAVAIHGDYAIVTAILDDTAAGTDAGSAYVFKRNGAAWEEQGKLTPGDATAGDNFAFLSMSSDGEYIICGGYKDDNAAGTDAGSAYVFRWNGTTWTQQAKLTASDGAAGDNFGNWASISGDYAIVGAYNDDTEQGANAGSVYLFKRDGAQWVEQTHFLPSATAANDNFGCRVAISGNMAIASAIFDDEPGVDSGSVYFLDLRPQSGVVTDPTNFRLDYLPNACGAADITIRATDTEGLWVEDTFHVTVNPVQDAPVMTSTTIPKLPTITEEDVNNSGTTVAQLLASDPAFPDPISDPDPAALEGIAVVASSQSSGTWQYSTNGGASWAALGTVSGSSALLLRPTDLVRFVPDGLNGSTDTLGFYAWDQTSGTAGSKANVSSRGGATAFSWEGVTASITVTPVNDAPVNTIPWASLAVDVFPGNGPSSPQNLTVSGGFLYFTATVPAYGRELWRTDGTTDGTVLIKDICEGIGSASPGSLTDVNGILYFSATDTTGDRELWRTDGTADGTVKVKDIHPSGSSSPDGLCNVNGTLFFAATDPTYGRELWKSAPSGLLDDPATTNIDESRNTLIVRDIYANSASSGPSGMINFNGTVFFSAFQVTGALNYPARELWKSEPSGQPDDPATTNIDESLNTIMVKDINPTLHGTEPDRAGSHPDKFTISGGKLYFVAGYESNPWANRQVFTTDGSAAGTIKLTSMQSNSPNFLPDYLTDVNGKLFFMAGYWTDRQLWATSGTLASTYQVAYINHGYNALPGPLGTLDGILYFRTPSATGNYELWRSDGTSSGTYLAVDTLPGDGFNREGLPQSMFTVDHTLFFLARKEQNSNVELWRSDGTQNGSFMFDILPGTTSSGVANMVNFNNTLFFSADDGTHGIELWKAVPFSQGGGIQDTFKDTPITFSGSRTISISDVDDGGGTMQVTLSSDHGTISLTTVAGLSFSFSDADGAAAGDGTGDSVMTFRGTKTAINTALASLTFTPDAGFIGDTYLEITTKDRGFTGSGGTLQDTDRVEIYVNALTSPVTMNNLAPVLSGTNSLTPIAEDNRTSGGTLVSDLIAGQLTDPDGPAQGIAVTGIDEANGQWKYSIDNGTTWLDFDGAISNTRSTLLGPDDLVRFEPNQDWNGTAHFYYRAWDQKPGYGNLHDTTVDTTLRGTVHAFSTAQADATIAVTAVNDPPVNSVPWATIAVDLVTGSTGSDPLYLTVSGGSLYFTASNAAFGRELWKTDGTADGTIFLKDIIVGTGGSDPLNLIDVNGTLFFTAIDASGGRELWKTDGTPDGTVRVKDIYAGATGSDPQYLRNVNGTLFFTADDGTVGRELWKSEPSGQPDDPATVDIDESRNTVLVKDIVPGTDNSQAPTELTELNGELVFAAWDSVHGRELWTSDGSAAGTVMLKDCDPNANNGNPGNLVNINGMLYFRASWQYNGDAELWKSDGTAAGTVLVEDIGGGHGLCSDPKYFTGAGGLVFFNGHVYMGDRELFVSDGTAAGTYTLQDPPGILFTRDPASLINFNDRLFFAANDTSQGRELWTSNGTEAGSVLVKDIYSGSTNSNPYSLTVAGETLYFGATTASGTEIFRSDGTSVGTVTHDANPGAGSSSPNYLVDFNGTLFFAADDGTHGRELWKATGHDSANAGVQNSYEENVLTLGGSNKISLSDVDAGASTMQVTLTSTHGTMTLAGIAGLDFAFAPDADGAPAGDGTTDTTMTFRGTAAAINTALNGLAFNPDIDYAGPAFIDIIAKDVGGTGSGGTGVDQDRVELYVNNINDPVTVASAPATMNQSFAALPESGTTLSFADIVLADPDTNDIITVTLTLNDLTAGTLTTPAGSTYDSATGLWTISSDLATVNAALRDVAFVQSAHWYGATTIDVNIYDTGGAGPAPGVINVQVNPVPDVPIVTITTTETSYHPISNDSASITPFPLAITVTDYDDASAGAPVGATENITVTITLLNPAAGCIGYAYTDGGADVWTFTGTLAQVNAAFSGLSYFPEPPHSPPFIGAAEMLVQINDAGFTGGIISDSIRVGVGCDVNNPPAPPGTSPTGFTGTWQEPPGPFLGGDPSGGSVLTLRPHFAEEGTGPGGRAHGGPGGRLPADQFDAAHKYSWEGWEGYLAARRHDEVFSLEGGYAGTIDGSGTSGKHKSTSAQPLMDFEDFTGELGAGTGQPPSAALELAEIVAKEQPLGNMVKNREFQAVAIFNMSQVTTMDLLAAFDSLPGPEGAANSSTLGAYLADSAPPLPISADERAALAVERAEAVLWEGLNRQMPSCTKCDELVQHAVQIFW